MRRSPADTFLRAYATAAPASVWRAGACAASAGGRVEERAGGGPASVERGRGGATLAGIAARRAQVAVSASV
ncbi:hypothetical protein [Actinocorallia sp. A-T 12471]|uniref:hypothetical protein n=1 Tax=Actinocorallia sp. A-T 12471 TaxID=3089813 RepID=UPI0029CEADCF|nr:hypothetical protein [Actinocorallia sp. A-T 12471]MDX6743129.1 hypothetical protein [Actinocorallia sp. A-T 12471]